MPPTLHPTTRPRRSRNPAHTAFFTLFVLLFVVTRLPLFLAGYGGDGDYWHVAAVAERILATGEFEIPRAPGNPLHVLQTVLALRLAALLNVSGWWITNLMALVWSIVLLGVVDRLRDQLGGSSAARVPLLILVASWPIFWAHSADAADHVPAATLGLAALALLLAPPRRWPVAALAGILLGAGAAFRLGTIALAPAALLAIWQLGRKRRILHFGAGLIITLGAAFWWILSTHSPAELGPFGSSFTLAGRLIRAVYRTQLALLPGLVAPAALVALLNPQLRRRARRLCCRPSAAERVLLVGLGGTLLLFATLPLDPAYLLPGALCALILLTRLLRRRGTLVTAGLAACAAIVTISPVDPATSKPRISLVPGELLCSVQEGRKSRDYPCRLLNEEFAPGTLVIVARPIEGVRSEEFSGASHILRPRDPYAPAISGVRAHPSLPGVWFAGYRAILREPDRAILLEKGLSLALDEDVLARAQRERGVNLLAAVSNWPSAVRVFDATPRH